MSLPQFTPQMLHALAQPSQASHQQPGLSQQQQDAEAVFHRPAQQLQPPVAPPGAVLSSTAQAAAAISAYLSGAASIVFPSQQAAADYQAAAVARAAGVGGPSAGVDDGLAWRQARAIEALLVQSGQHQHHHLQQQQSWPLGGWQQHQQSFYGAALQSLAFQQQQQQQQPAYGLMQQQPMLIQPALPGQPPAGSSLYGLSDTSSASTFVAAALSPPATTPRTCSSSGDSSTSSPLLSVASLSSSTAGGSGLHQGYLPPTVYSASPSTGDPFELAPTANGSEGLEFKDLFGFSPAVALGGSFAAGPPMTQQQQPQQQQQQQQQLFNECVPSFDLNADACLFDPPGPDDVPLSVAPPSVGSAPYLFNALPADATSGYSSASPASTGGSSAVSPPASNPAQQPTQAELAQAAAAHFAWNQSVNMRDPKKRHVCVVCARGFARAFNLKSHMATHDQNRAKPFTCPHEGCARGFSRSHDLERHRVGIHQGESSKPFSAESFKERYAHTRHFARISSKDVGDDLGLASDVASFSSGSSTASATSSNAQDSKHTTALRAKKRSIRGVPSAA